MFNLIALEEKIEGDFWGEIFYQELKNPQSGGLWGVWWEIGTWLVRYGECLESIVKVLNCQLIYHIISTIRIVGGI